MKKSLEAELKRLAEKIMHLKNNTDVHELKSVAGILYEKLSVLSFAEKHFEGTLSPNALEQVENAMSGKEKNPQQVENDENRYAPDGTQYNPEGITEPNTEMIKDIVAQMPIESEEIDEVMGELLPEENAIDELRNIGVHYDDLPQFEPVEKNSPKENPAHTTEKELPQNDNKTESAVKKTTAEEQQARSVPEEGHKQPMAHSFTPKEEPKNNTFSQKISLNDRLKKGVSFGLNERLVYVKHLFNGNISEYDRVLSQLNTFHSYDGAKKFIETVVKPDYDHWEGEELYEKRFLTALENKLN